MAQNYGAFFQKLQRFLRLFFPTFDFPPLPQVEGPRVFVSRHQNLRGPASIFIWTEEFIRVWALAVFFDEQTCYKQYREFTFTERFGMPQWLADPLAKCTSRLASRLLASMQAIPVYRGSRQIIDTFKLSVEAMHEGDPILIFPDKDYASEASEIAAIYDGFLYLEKVYYKKYGEHVTFIPLFSDVKHKAIYYGEPLKFTGEMPFKQERTLIRESLIEALNYLGAKSTRQGRRK